MQFIGRQAELQQLSRFLERSPDFLAVVYGRRRVGKSELLRQAIRASNLPYVSSNAVKPASLRIWLPFRRASALN